MKHYACAHDLTCPLLTISDFFNFFIAYILPDIFSRQSLTCDMIPYENQVVHQQITYQMTDVENMYIPRPVK